MAGQWYRDRQVDILAISSLTLIPFPLRLGTVRIKDVVPHFGNSLVLLVAGVDLNFGQSEANSFPPLIVFMLTYASQVLTPDLQLTGCVNSTIYVIHGHGRLK